jgi:hypothetical protein
MVFVLIAALIAVMIGGPVPSQGRVNGPIPITVIAKVPNGVTIEWFGFDSHLGRPMEYCEAHPIILLIPIPEWAKAAYVTLRGDVLNSVELAPPEIERDAIRIRAGWWGPEWRLGIAFSR